jgi:hypothetical protein
MQIPGDGTWTCIICGSDGPARTLSCPGFCRACQKCYFGDEARDGAGDARHTCCRTADDVLRCMRPGHRLVMLPDMGYGRTTWEQHGQTWQTAHGMWSIESQEELDSCLTRILTGVRGDMWWLKIKDTCITTSQHCCSQKWIYGHTDADIVSLIYAHSCHVHKHAALRPEAFEGKSGFLFVQQAQLI